MEEHAIYTMHDVDQEKLESVMVEMKRLGPPIIRACWQGDHYCALEGTHRVEAARILGMPVIIQAMDEDDEFENHDLQDLEDPCTVEDVLLYGEWVHGGHIQDVRTDE